uniref:Uncharacterized protein n=1 Tax=Rhizophora mucronata TaxID=61149 RepID=A0A2P2N9K2_RHIMU
MHWPKQMQQHTIKLFILNSWSLS